MDTATKIVESRTISYLVFFASFDENETFHLPRGLTGVE